MTATKVADEKNRSESERKPMYMRQVLKIRLMLRLKVSLYLLSKQEKGRKDEFDKI